MHFDDVIAYLFRCLLASVLIAWIILGNLFTCYGLVRFKPPKNAFGMEKRRRITINYLLSNSLADLCIGLFVTPLALFQDVWYWPFKSLCWPWVGIDVTCCTASCLSLLVISIDRFFSCIKPMPPKWYNDRLSHLIILFVWMISVGTASMSMFVSVVIKNENSIQDRKINRTNVTNSLCVASFTPEMTFISTLVSFVIPGIAIVIANIGIVVVGSRLCKSDRFRYKRSLNGDQKQQKKTESTSGIPEIRILLQKCPQVRKFNSVAFKKRSPKRISERSRTS